MDCTGQIQQGGSLHSPATRGMRPAGSCKWQQDPVWQSHVSTLLNFPKQIRVLELCGGLSSGFLASQLLLGSDKVMLAGYFDIDDDIRSVVNAIHGDSDCVHLGQTEGNILAIDVAKFPASEIICAGPPCPPWSDKGMKHSFNDDRAAVFWKTVEVVIHQGTHGQLITFVLENVQGIMKRRQGSDEPPVKIITRRLQEGLPGWDVEVLLVNTMDFGLPQSRPRVYIVGRRKSWFPRGRPPALTQFSSRVRLSDLLSLEESGQWHKKYTPIQLNNIQDFKNKYKLAMQDPGQRGRFMVVDMSRTPSGRTVWGNTEHQPDTVECLTASGPALHVFALGEGVGQLSLDRKLLGCEHGRLQGFPASVVSASARVSERIAKRMFGNAMSVPVVGSIIARELCALQRSSLAQEGSVLDDAGQRPSTALVVPGSVAVFGKKARSSSSTASSSGGLTMLGSAGDFDHKD